MSTLAALRAIATPVSATFAIQTLVAFAVYSAPVMAPVAGPALGYSASAVGYFVSISYLGSMVGSVAGGGLVARYGPIRVSQCGLSLCLLGLAFGASAVPALVVLGAFTIGLGYGPTTPASSQILVRAAPPTLAALTFSIKQTGVPAGGVLAGALVPAMILVGGWQGAALAIGAACLALALLIAPLSARFDAERDARAPLTLRSVFAPLAEVAGDRGLRRMAIASFVYGGVQVTLVTFLVTFVVESFHLSLVLAGLVMAVSQVASVIGRLAWGVLADRVLPGLTVLGLLGLGMATSAFLTLVATPDWPLWVLFIFAGAFGATAVGWNGVFLAEVARVAGRARASSATGGCLFFTFFGVMIAPLVFNAVHAWLDSYAAAFAVFGVPSLAIAVMLLRAARES